MTQPMSLWTPATDTEAAAARDLADALDGLTTAQDPESTLLVLENLGRTCVRILGATHSISDGSRVSLSDLVRSAISPVVAPVVAAWAGTDPEEVGPELADDLADLDERTRAVRAQLQQAEPALHCA